MVRMESSSSLFEVLYEKTYSKNLFKIHTKTPAMEKMT